MTYGDAGTCIVDEATVAWHHTPEMHGRTSVHMGMPFILARICALVAVFYASRLLLKEDRGGEPDTVSR